MLTFNLKKEWFEKIKSGEKTHEYRVMKRYWLSRLAKYFEGVPADHKIAFRCGYNGEILIAIMKSVRIVFGNTTDLEINDFVIDIEFELLEEKLVGSN